jgi:hypothetical protein
MGENGAVEQSQARSKPKLVQLLARMQLLGLALTPDAALVQEQATPANRHNEDRQDDEREDLNLVHFGRPFSARLAA